MSNYLRLELAWDLVQKVNGTIVECNTAYEGAIKNASIDIVSSADKLWIHTGGHSKTSWGGGTREQFCDAMADAAKAVTDCFGHGKRIVYVNVMNCIGIDCDCNGNLA